MSSVSPSGRSLHRLVYFSRSLLRPAEFESEVDAIIRQSINNNRIDNITGLLFCHDGWFLQALEGPATAVQTAFGRITADRRHDGAKVLSAGPVDQRLFREWDMCARTLSMVDATVASTLERRGPFEPARLSGEAATRLLATLRTVRADAARRLIA